LAVVVTVVFALKSHLVGYVIGCFGDVCDSCMFFCYGDRFVDCAAGGGGRVGVLVVFVLTALCWC
jgi:hypothetical protein